MPEPPRHWDAQSFWWCFEMVVDRVNRDLGFEIPSDKIEEMILICLLDNAVPAGHA